MSGNAIGSDPIGGVGSGGVAEVCEGNPFFATGGTPVVPVAHRMPIGAPMSGFEKPPKPAPNVEKGARWRFDAPGANGGVKGGCRRKTLCVKFIYDWR